MYKIGDKVKFIRDDDSTYEAFIIFFYEDGKIQLADNRNMICQNFVVSPDKIVSKVFYP